MKMKSKIILLVAGILFSRDLQMLATAYRLYVTFVFAIVVIAKLAGIVVWLASKATIVSAKTAYAVFKIVFRAIVLVGMYIIAPQLTIAYILFSLMVRSIARKIAR